MAILIGLTIAGRLLAMKGATAPSMWGCEGESPSFQKPILTLVIKHGFKHRSPSFLNAFNIYVSDRIPVHVNCSRYLDDFDEVRLVEVLELDLLLEEHLGQRRSLAWVTSGLCCIFNGLF